MTVLAIVQARMGSTRLPGKVLRDILGKPLLWHVLHRLKKCSKVDQVVVATTTASEDDTVEQFCREQRVSVIRGPQDNVLARFDIAVQRFDPDMIVRVNADAPLVDPDFIDHMIGTMMKEGADTVFAAPDVPCVHDGVDPISRAAFDRLTTHAADDPVAIEHVTGYLKKNPSFATIAELEVEPELQYQGARLSIDTQADVEFVETLYRRAGCDVGELNIRAVVSMLRADPQLGEINSHVLQKSLDQESGVILIRCDGGREVGFGHVTRSLAVARALRDRQGYGVVFAMACDRNANERVASEGFPVEKWSAGMHEEAWLDSLVHRHRPRGLFLDIRTGLSRSSVHKVKQNVPLTILLDDGSARRLEGDIVVYPPVQQVEDLDWIGFSGTKLVGWEWIMLPGRSVRKPAGHRGDGAKKVLVTMGGSDPLDLTWEVACRLSSLPFDVAPVFVIGPGFGQPELLEKRLRGLFPDAEILLQPSSLAQTFAGVDLAITMYGVTAQELAASGVPAVYVCLDEDHLYSARSLTDRGVGVTLGLADDIDWFNAADTIASLMSDGEELALMAKRGPRLIDGQGADRLAELVSRQLKKKVAA